MNDILSHPRIAELRQRRKALLQRLTEVVSELQHLKDAVLPELLAEYDTHFRALEIQLQQQTLLTAEITRREELFRIKLGRGEKLSSAMISVVNTIVDREFERIKKRFRESFTMTSKEREKEATERMEKHNDSEFVGLYRSIVKKLHPDAAAEELPHSDVAPNQFPKSDAFEKFWYSAQDAYKSRNMRELQAIYDIVCLAEELEDFATLLSAEEHLEAEILRLESRLRNEQRRLREIVNNPPYSLRELMKSPTWIEKERLNLERQIADKERNFERARAFLASLNALDLTDWHNAEKNSPTAAQEEFTNDFMENTYFNNR